MDNAKCAILVPVARRVEPHCDLALRQLEAAGYPVRRLYGYSQIDRARNRLATDALAEGFDELFWIDSDMAFEPSLGRTAPRPRPAHRLRPLSHQGREEIDLAPAARHP